MNLKKILKNNIFVILFLYHFCLKNFLFIRYFYIVFHSYVLGTIHILIKADFVTYKLLMSYVTDF